MMDVARVVSLCVLWGLILCLTSVCALPSIEVPPRTVTVVVRGTAILTCKVMDKGMYTVNWIKSNKLISRDGSIDSSAVDPTRYSIVGDPLQGNYSLKITNVLTLDNDPFKCQLRAPSGDSSIASEPVDLIVQHPPGEGYPQCSPDYLRIQELPVGSMVNFGCSTARGEPVAHLNWTFHGTEVDSIMDDSVAGFIGLNFAKNVTVEDNEKTFICILTHELLPEPRTCQVGPLDVIFPPVETIITTSQPVSKVGGTLILYCEVNANPILDVVYTWYTIPPSPEVGESQVSRIDDQGFLVWVLRDLTNEDDGTMVVCEARNKLGALNGSFTVTVFRETTTTPLVLPTKVHPLATSNPSSGGFSFAPYVIILILIAVSMFLLTIAVIIFVLKRKKRPTSAVITVTDLDNIHADVHSLASFGNLSRQGTPYLDRVDYELGRSRSHSRDMFDNISLDSASALVGRAHSRESPTHRKYSVDSLGKPLRLNDQHHRGQSSGSPVHHPAKRLDSSPVKERKPSDSAHSQAGRPLPKINGAVEQNEYAELTPVSARKKYNALSQASVTSPESGFGEDDVLIKPLNDSNPSQSSNNCNCGRKMSHVEV